MHAFLSVRRSLLALFALGIVLGQAGPASAANVLLVLDGTDDAGLATVLTGDGHTVMTVMNDASFPTTSPLLGDLSAYDVVVWSHTGGFRASTVYTNLNAFVTAGGRVFYTGANSLSSDFNGVTFLGGTSWEGFTQPGAITSVMAAETLTTGLVDIRGVTPTFSPFSSRNALFGVGGGTITVAMNIFGSGAEWALRPLGDGYIAYVANGMFGGTDSSWTTTTGAPGARAYNAAIRNFVYNAGGFSGTCTGEGGACTSSSGRTGVCHTSRCCVGCWDGTDCFSGTTGVACGVDGEACISCSDDMPCTLDVCTAGACSNPDAPTGALCEDGEFCTVGETCNSSGVCSGGRPNTCNDMSDCSADSCDEDADMCIHDVGGSGCYIGGTCYGAFTVNSSNRCQACLPSLSTTSWSPRAVGTPCGTGSCSGGPGSAMLNDGGRCDATGSCGPATTTPCPSGLCSPSGTSCSSTCTAGSCPGGATCSTTTMTCMPRQAIGRSCGGDGDCISDHCSDGVCCIDACDGLCDSCDLPGSIGTCMPTPLGGSCGDPICSGTSITLPGVCDDAGECHRDTPRRCPQGRCETALSCASTCTPDSCAPGEICTAELVCVTPAENGGVCGADDHCVSGFCVDGVCCNRRCDDICEACDNTGRIGTCTPYVAGVDPELECPVGNVCNGGHGCMPGADTGPGLPDGGPGFDAGGAVEMRGCSCRAAGLPTPAHGLAAIGLGLLGLLVARRRRG